MLLVGNLCVTVWGYNEEIDVTSTEKGGENVLRVVKLFY